MQTEFSCTGQQSLRKYFIIQQTGHALGIYAAVSAQLQQNRKCLHGTSATPWRRAMRQTSHMLPDAAAAVTVDVAVNDGVEWSRWLVLSYKCHGRVAVVLWSLLESLCRPMIAYAPLSYRISRYMTWCAFSDRESKPQAIHCECDVLNNTLSCHVDGSIKLF